MKEQIKKEKQQLKLDQHPDDYNSVSSGGEKEETELNDDPSFKKPSGVPEIIKQ